jgi:MFS family permease
VQAIQARLLRGPRVYGRMHRGSRRPSHSSGTKISIVSKSGGEQESIEDGLSKSPYIGGVGVVRFWLIFGGVLFNFFVACFDSTIMVSSHPVITSYFNGANSASWLSTAFLLTSTSFQPLFGRLSDTIGRKPPYIFCLTVFLSATIWCALAQSMTSFIAARALCGLGAGGMVSLGSIITSDLVPIEIRGAYQSYMNAVYGAGAALGAALGGAIADTLGWRWEFGVQVPLLAIALVMACFTTPPRLGLQDGVKQKTVMEAMKVFDFKGSVLLTTSITFFILGIVSSALLKWTISLLTQWAELGWKCI